MSIGKKVVHVDDDQLISSSRWREFIDVSRMTWWRWEASGKVPPPIRIGNRRFRPKSQLKNLGRHPDTAA